MKLDGTRGDLRYHSLSYLVAGEGLGCGRVLHLVEVRCAVQLRAGDGHLTNQQTGKSRTTQAQHTQERTHMRELKKVVADRSEATPVKCRLQ